MVLFTRRKAGRHTLVLKSCEADVAADWRCGAASMGPRFCHLGICSSPLCPGAPARPLGGVLLGPLKRMLQHRTSVGMRTPLALRLLSRRLRSPGPSHIPRGQRLFIPRLMLLLAGTPLLFYFIPGNSVHQRPHSQLLLEIPVPLSSSSLDLMSATLIRSGLGERAAPLSIRLSSCSVERI